MIYIEGETYVDSKKFNHVFNSNIIQVRNDIKKYDFDKFRVVKSVSPPYVDYDKEFKNLLNNIGVYNLKLCFSVTECLANIFDLEFELPIELQRVGIAYNVYKKVAIEYNFITTDKFCTGDATNVWYNLICDDLFYSFTSNFFTGIIYKNISDDVLKDILLKIKHRVNTHYNPKFGLNFNDIKFDKFLLSKMNEINL